MQAQILAVEYARDVDYSNVRHDDRPEIENIIVGLVTFERTMPKLQLDIHDAGDHYNISVKGYNHSIDFLRFYNKFLGENSPYDFIQGVTFTPSSGIFVVNVKKRDFSESRRATAASDASAFVGSTVIPRSLAGERSPPSPARSRSKSRSRSHSSKSRSRRSQSRRK